MAVVAPPVAAAGDTKGHSRAYAIVALRYAHAAWTGWAFSMLRTTLTVLVMLAVLSPLSAKAEAAKARGGMG